MVKGKVYESGLGAKDFEFRAPSLGFRVLGVGFRV